MRVYELLWDLCEFTHSSYQELWVMHEFTYQNYGLYKILIIRALSFVFAYQNYE